MAKARTVRTKSGRTGKRAVSSEGIRKLKARGASQQLIRAARRAKS
jgi:hypothetical protein